MATIIVRPDDTLSAIAKRAGMNVLDLIAQNPQFANPNLIRGGEQVFISGKESSPRARRIAAETMLSHPLPSDPNFASYYDEAGKLIADARIRAPGITPSIEPGLATPQVDGLSALEDAYSTPQTYLGQLEAAGISFPPKTADRPRGLQEFAFDAPTIPGAARNVEQIQEELSKQIGYDVRGIQSQAGLADYIDPGLGTIVGGTMGTGEITQGLFGGLLSALSGAGGPTAEQYTRMAELQTQGMSVLESREQALSEQPSVVPGEKPVREGPADRAGSYYGLGSKPLTLPKNTEGESYLPSAFLRLSEQIQRGHRTDAEIAESLAERLMTAPNLAPISENPPENILLNTGDVPNDAFVRIQQIILAYLEQEARASPYDIDIQTIFAQFQNAGSLEEFYAMLGYGPSDIHPNIWTRQAGLLNENVVDPADVAASILSGQSFYNASRNPNLFSGGGSGGGSGRRAVSNSWGQASGGLYLWRIGA